MSEIQKSRFFFIWIITTFITSPTLTWHCFWNSHNAIVELLTTGWLPCVITVKKSSFCCRNASFWQKDKKMRRIETRTRRTKHSEWFSSSNLCNFGRLIESCCQGNQAKCRCRYRLCQVKSKWSFHHSKDSKSTFSHCLFCIDFENHQLFLLESIKKNF